MTQTKIIFVLPLLVPSFAAASFVHHRHYSHQHVQNNHYSSCRFLQENDRDYDDSDKIRTTTTFEVSDSSSKNIVSSLTDFVNFFMKSDKTDASQETCMFELS